MLKWSHYVYEKINKNPLDLIQCCICQPKNDFLLFILKQYYPYSEHEDKRQEASDTKSVVPGAQNVLGNVN